MTFRKNSRRVAAKSTRKMGRCMWGTSRMAKLKDWVYLSLLTDHTTREKWWTIWQNHQRGTTKTTVFSTLEGSITTSFMGQAGRREFRMIFKESSRTAAESTEF